MNEIFHRTSIRKFTEQPVEEEKIQTILKAAMAAPSAMNQQPWEFYVVTNKEKIVELSKCSRFSGCAAGASVVFVPCYKKKLIANDFAHIDLSAATENMLLEIDSLGLGGTWLAVAPDEKRMSYVQKTLDIPNSLHPFALVICGYPAEEKQQQDRYEEKRVHWVK